MNVIDRIEKLRKEKHWTKYRLAEEATLTYSTLAAMYARQTPPKLDVLELICGAFGITLAQFFLEEDPVEIVTEQEKSLLHAFRSLSDNKKQALLVVLNDEERQK